MSSSTTTPPTNPPPPPGFQLMFSSNTPAMQQQRQKLQQQSESSNPRITDDIAFHTPFNYITLPIHWSIIRTPHPHNYRLISGSEVFSETLPRDWIVSCVKREVGDGVGKGAKYIELFYKDVSPGGEVMRVKILETLVEKEVAVSVSAAGGDGSEGGRGVRDEVGLIKVQDYLVNGGRDNAGDFSSCVGKIYKVAGLWELEGVVQKLITGGSRLPDPYASKIPPARLKQLEEEKEQRRRLREEQEEQQSRSNQQPQPPRSTGGLGIGSTFPDPLRPDIGRSDLDPFSGIGGAGGMLMDPRGFRRPQLPQGIVPGARFDPIGPSPFGGGGFGGLGGRGGRGGGMGGPPGAPRLPFGFPDPDHERIPGGYDDMFM